MRQGRRRNNRGVGNFDAVMYLVALLQAAQDCDGVFHRRLLNEDLLEAPLKGRVFLNILAILVQSGSTDAMQFPAGQGRLQHIARIHRAFRLTCANHRMQFINKQDDLAFLPGNIMQNGFQPLLEFTAVFGACDQRAHIQ